ncbi:Protein MMS22-like [Dirofilaria immitis]
MNETQKDLFESARDLPEWLPVDWVCQNRCPERIIDDYTLPSVQYSLPSFLKLSTFSFNANMLYTDSGIKTVFRCLRFIYHQIACDTTEIAIVDLDRSLSYLVAFAQNLELDGDVETLNRIVREFKFFLVQAGSLNHYIASDGLFTARNVETNYIFHALLIIWMKAIRISSFFKRFSGFEKFYPMGDASSSTEQLSMLVSYGLLLSASRTDRPYICRCVTAAWHQLYVFSGQMFWSNMVKLLGLCTGDIHYYPPESPSSDMFLDLCDVGGTVSAETFLEIICELDTGFENVCIVSGKASSNYIECLQQIASKVSEKKYILRKLYFLFDKRQGDSLLGTESILQHFFTYLCSNIMEPPDRELDFYPTNGKVWKDFLFSCCSNNTGDQYSDWMLFIRLMSMLIKKSESVWRAMKSRIFSKFPAKRFREMPIHSLICVFSLFIASLHEIDMEDTSRKIISLAIAAFDPSDKERHDILIRAVQCTKYILDDNHHDSSQAIATLTTLMGKLDDKKDVSLYAECCMCIGEKVTEVGSLVRFLSSMNDMDLEKLFVMTSHCRIENSVLWNAAVNHLKNPNSAVAINYIVEQLAIKFERSRSAVQNMRQVVQNLLAEKSYKSEVCLYFLRKFLKKTNDAIYPVELIVPLWLVVSFEKPNTDELNDISATICKNLRISFRKNGLYFEAFSEDSSSTVLSIRWLFETISKNATNRNSTKWILENIMSWSELLVPPLHCILMNAEETTIIHCCRIMSYLYLYVAQQIYKPPSECNFNRSPFVRFCKLMLQNVLLVREFPAVFIREVLPNYMTGMLSLPVHSVPYLLRVVSDVLEKHLDDNVLKGIFTKMLKEKPQLTAALYASSKVGTSLFNFVSQIK